MVLLLGSRCGDRRFFTFSDHSVLKLLELRLSMSYPAHYGPLATECGTCAMHTRQLSTSHALTGRTQAPCHRLQWCESVEVAQHRYSIANTGVLRPSWSWICTGRSPHMKSQLPQCSTCKDSRRYRALLKANKYLQSGAAMAVTSGGI